MDSRKEKILIYSNASPAEEQQLAISLEHVGYQNSYLVKNRVQLGKLLQQGDVAALILLLTAEDSCQSKVIDILMLNPSIPVLGLFSEACPLFVPAIVKACHEIDSFPCHENELDFRLGRIICHDFSSEEVDVNIFQKMKLIGQSPAFQQVLKKIHKIMCCDAPVYIDGETGTGKELVARAIHYLGSRKDQPFIAANCGALPDQLIENELFGHEKGAFTDASSSSEGLIAQADGGTLFLDEIETLSTRGQVVLLRFMENLMYRPLGSTGAKKANVRVIVATNENIEQMVQQGQFRKDLYYRINLINILLPPLRERVGDIQLLAEHFIRQLQLQYEQPSRTLHPDSMLALRYHDWPGNVRELENTLHREFLMAEGRYVYIDDLQVKKRERRAFHADRRLQDLMSQPMVEAKTSLIQEFEQHYLASALDKARGNISEAARISGKERRSFTRLMEKYEMLRS
jgi:DNA-binding NtrC family response regulator